MKSGIVVKIIAALVIPGSIPVYLGYKVFQLGKRVYENSKKKANNKDEEKP